LQEEKDGLQDPQAAKLAQRQNHGNHQQSLKVSTDGAVRVPHECPVHRWPGAIQTRKSNTIGPALPVLLNFAES
jgi:hypothetical protein